MKLLQTKDCLLLTDEEAKIKERDNSWLYRVGNNSFIQPFIYKNNEQWIIDNEESLDYLQPTFLKTKTLKMVAYYPLTEEAKELDLLLLPPPLEVIDLMELKFSESLSLNHKTTKEDGIIKIDGISARLFRNIWVEGYQAVQSKGQYSLEDMKKAIEITKSSMGVDNCGESYYSNKTTDEIIQSLSTQQLPKEFIPEYEIGAYPSTGKQAKRLKTIINSEGKEVLVGTYKY